MNRAQEIREAISPRVRKVLLVAETALPPSQFAAFRTYVFDEFGKSGLEADLEALLSGSGRDRA